MMGRYPTPIACPSCGSYDVKPGQAMRVEYGQYHYVAVWICKRCGMEWKQEENTNI